MSIIKIHLIVGAILTSISKTDSFVPSHLGPTRLNTALFLEDKIAQMIDRELYRQTHKKEFEEKNRIKNNEVIEKILPEEFDVANAFEITNEENSMVKRKDKRLAAKNPQAYCADRCITTGNCDVFEDLFELSPVQVLEFCEECVLSEDEEPCDVPDKFYDDGFSSLQP